MDAQSSWWISELLAAECKKAWCHPEWDTAMHQWYNWLHERKKDEEQRRAEERQKLASRFISSAEGAGFLHRITKPTARRGGLAGVGRLGR